MDPIGPEGCAGADFGWAGQPLDTAHLRLRAAQAGALDLIVEERLSGRIIGDFAIRLAPSRLAFIKINVPEPGFFAESLRRCLRMLFDNFAADLVEAEFPTENPELGEILRAHRFALEDAGKAILRRGEWLSWRADRKILLVVAAALIDPDGRVLLARRPAGKSMAGQWEFPGGKIAPGESPEQALVRELREELGIETTGSCLAPLAFASHDYDHFHLAMPLYALRQWQGRPVGREGQKLAWVGKDRLADYPMPPAGIPLVAQLRDWL